MKSSRKGRRKRESEKIFKIIKEERWTPVEEENFLEIINFERRNDWKEISRRIGRSQQACYSKFLNVKYKDTHRGKLTKEEDELILKYVDEIGPKWAEIAKLIKTRTGKQVRDRYVNHLSKDIKKTKFTLEEDLIVLKFQKKLGNSWTEIAHHLPGRSPDNVKIRYNNSIKNNVNLLLFLERRDLGVSEVKLLIKILFNSQNKLSTLTN
jgi:hypothetical protein